MPSFPGNPGGFMPGQGPSFNQAVTQPVLRQPVGPQVGHQVGQFSPPSVYQGSQLPQHQTQMSWGVGAQQSMGAHSAIGYMQVGGGSQMVAQPSPLPVQQVGALLPGPHPHGQYHVADILENDQQLSTYPIPLGDFMNTKTDSSANAKPTNKSKPSPWALKAGHPSHISMSESLSPRGGSPSADPANASVSSISSVGSLKKGKRVVFDDKQLETSIPPTVPDMKQELQQSLKPLSPPLLSSAAFYQQPMQTLPSHIPRPQPSPPPHQPPQSPFRPPPAPTRSPPAPGTMPPRAFSQGGWVPGETRRMIVATRGIQYHAEALMIALAAKGMAFDVFETPLIDSPDCPKWFTDASPSGNVPILFTLPPSGIPTPVAHPPDQTHEAIRALDSSAPRRGSPLVPSDVEHVITGTVVVAQSLLRSFELLVESCTLGQMQEPLDSLIANMARLEAQLAEQEVAAGGARSSPYFLGDRGVISLADVWLAPLAPRVKLLHLMTDSDPMAKFPLSARYLSGVDGMREYALSAVPLEAVRNRYERIALGDGFGGVARGVECERLSSVLRQVLGLLLQEVTEDIFGAKADIAAAKQFASLKVLHRATERWRTYRLLSKTLWELHRQLGPQAVGMTQAPDLSELSRLMEESFLAAGSAQEEALSSLLNQVTRAKIDQEQSFSLLAMSLSLFIKTTPLEEQQGQLCEALKAWKGGVGYLLLPVVLDKLPSWQSIQFATLLLGLRGNDGNWAWEVSCSLRDGAERGSLAKARLEELLRHGAPVLSVFETC